MSARRRLLTILPGQFIGGVERYGLTIGTAAAADGWEVHAAFPHTAANNDLVTAFGEADATTHSLEARATGPSFVEVATTARRTSSLLGEVRPSVVHMNLPLPTVARGSLIGCAVRGVPTVAMFHSTPHENPDPGRSRALYPLLRRRSQTWVAPSEHVRRSVAGSFGVPPGTVTVIPNGVPAAAPETPERAEVRTELGLPESAYLALSVGRLGSEKGHADLIRAAAGLVERFPDVHFVTAGEGEQHARLEALIRDSGLRARVHLAGQRNDIDRLLAAADLFAFPSYFEGSPFALLEAGAHALRIVSADFLGARDVIVDGSSGLLHPPGDVEALSRCLEFAFEHPEEMRAMGERARETVSTSFSRDRMIEATLALLGAQADLQ